MQRKQKQREMSIIEELEKRYILLINDPEFIESLDWSECSREEISKIMDSDGIGTTDISYDSFKKIAVCWANSDVKN